MNKKQLIDLIKDLPDDMKIYIDHPSVVGIGEIYRVNSVYTQEHIPRALRENVIILTTKENVTNIPPNEIDF